MPVRRTTRTVSNPTAAPTDRQIGFLQSLFIDRKTQHDERTPEATAAWLDWQAQLQRTNCWNRGDVSSIIDTLQAMPSHRQQRRAEAAAAAANAVDRAAQGTSLRAQGTTLNAASGALRNAQQGEAQWTQGVHVVTINGNETICRVGPSPRERLYANATLRVWTLRLPRQVGHVTTRPRWTRTPWTQAGRPFANADGTDPTVRYRTYSPVQFTHDTLLTMEQAERIGAQYGFCARCGRLLTDPTSVTRGIGPVCIRAILGQDAMRELRAQERAARQAQEDADAQRIIAAHDQRSAVAHDLDAEAAAERDMNAPRCQQCNAPHGHEHVAQCGEIVIDDDGTEHPVSLADCVPALTRNFNQQH